MERVKDWENAHKEVIEFHMSQPGVYGTSDCYIICDDNVKAITGKYMFPKARNYKSVKGAAKQLVKHGFENVEQAFASLFEETPPTLAQRGDIGVIDDNGAICGGVFTALGFAVRGDERLYFMPVSSVKTAFKVGR